MFDYIDKRIRGSIEFCSMQTKSVGVDHGVVYKACLDSYLGAYKFLLEAKNSSKVKKQAYAVAVPVELPPALSVGTADGGAGASDNGGGADAGDPVRGNME